MTTQDVCLMSDGLPLTHIWAVFDRSVSEGDGYKCWESYKRLADTSMDEENAGLAVIFLVLPCQS